MKNILFILFFLFTLSGAEAQTTRSEALNVRGFHLDLRIQVMTMDALKEFTRKLKNNGINTLVMEWEGTYPFEKHPLIPNRFAYSKNEIVSFLSYCKNLGIDVIPLQQSFGHVEYILRHNRYKELREDQKDYSQVCPLQTQLDSLLFSDLYAELAQTHSSKYIHIGGDETYLLGHDEKCRLKAAKEGKSKLYIDYISMICQIVIGLGKRPVLWADIAIQYPDAIKLLPKETVFVDWNYGWELNRFGNHQALIESGYEIWGSPSIRSFPDNYYLSDWKKHFNNIRDFIPLSRKLGYKGVVMTSWSTSGVYSPVFESESNMTELFAIRHVYPLSGFNILTQAYFQSVASETALDVKKFVRDYCANQFGFSNEQSALFWRYLTTTPYEIRSGKISAPRPMEIRELLDSTHMVVKGLTDLKPKKNSQEFEHFLLMAKIRNYYVTYQLIESKVNEPSFTTSGIPGTLKELEDLLRIAEDLNSDFTRLQKGFLHPAEIEEENEIRNIKVRNLYNRLSKKR